MPKAAFTDLKAYEQKPIGNGPFMMDGSWEHNRQIKMKRFAAYKGPRPAKSAGVVFKTYASRDAAYTDLRAGNVDIDTQIPAAKVPEAKRLLADRFLSVPSGTMDFLEFPLYDPAFKNPNLRKAISMAIDRQAIVNAVYNGTFKPTGSLLAPIVPGYRATACGEACTYNPHGGQQLYDQAGGFKGTLHLMFSNADPTYEQWMTDVANQLKQNLGIANITFDKVQASDYISKLIDHKGHRAVPQQLDDGLPEPGGLPDAAVQQAEPQRVRRHGVRSSDHEGQRRQDPRRKPSSTTSRPRTSS